MFGDRVVLAYSVGGTDVLEMAGLQTDWGVRTLSRTFEVGADQGGDAAGGGRD